MGWTFHHRDKGIDNQAYWQEHFSDRYDVLAVAQVAFTELYAAVRHPDGYVFAFVALVRYVPNDYYNFGYKDMDESMGPNIARCPERILEMLDPIPGEVREPNPDSDEWHEQFGNGAYNAREWRKACRDYHARRKAAKQVKPGDVVVFGHPVRFTSGAEMTEMRLVKGNVLTDQYGYGRYRYPGWRSAMTETFTPSDDDPRYNAKLAFALTDGIG